MKRMGNALIALGMCLTFAGAGAWYSGLMVQRAEIKKAFVSPSANAMRVIEEIATGADDWETTDYNGYFSYFYSPSRNLLMTVRPSFKESESVENAISVGRIDRIMDGRWWLDSSWKYLNPVAPPDSTAILNAAMPFLRKAKAVVKTYPDKLGPVVASRGDRPKEDGVTHTEQSK